MWYVYLMYRWWRGLEQCRIGMTVAHNITHRCYSEGANKVWLLYETPSKEEASFAEDYFSSLNGIPQRTWIHDTKGLVSVEGLEHFWEKAIGNNWKKGEYLIEGDPFWQLDRGTVDFFRRRIDNRIDRQDMIKRLALCEDKLCQLGGVCYKASCTAEARV